MRLSRQKRVSSFGFDMTPMIDVVMQLLIFFMFTTQFASITTGDVQLPKEAGEEAGEVAEIVIDVRADGSLAIGGRDASSVDIAAAIEKEAASAGGDPSGLRVLVRADARAKSAAVNDLARVLITAKVRTWRLGTASEEGAP